MFNLRQRRPEVSFRYLVSRFSQFRQRSYHAVYHETPHDTPCQQTQADENDHRQTDADSIAVNQETWYHQSYRPIGEGYMLEEDIRIQAV